MQHTSQRVLATLLAGLVGAASLAVPNMGAFAGGSSTGPQFSSSPARGLTGSAIRASGERCLLPDGTTAGDGVTLVLRSSTGRVVADETLPVRADGRWRGTLQVPPGTDAGDYTLAAHCIYPGFFEQDPVVHEQDPVVYRPRAFAVTGDGPAAGTPESPATRESGSSAIEPFPSYEGQTTCSPTPKPGMVAFQSMVMAAYPGSGNFGIVRACNVGGSSEHKEGRAWVWQMNAASAGDRAEVANLMSWLFATDSAGNRYANARRLGVMYIIWNRKMFRLYRAEAGWQPYSGPSPHTDHVHFSLTRAGGNKTTSFWRGSYPRPGQAGTPPPPPQPVPTPMRPDSYELSRIDVSGTYDTPVSGDFGGDRHDDILWYGTGNLPDFIWFGKEGGGFTARGIVVRGVYRTPLVGDFDGDRRDDILWYGPGDDDDYLWTGRSDGTFTGHNLAVHRSYDRPIVGDFNGDRYSDVLWYQTGTGFDFLWHGTAFGFLGQPITANGTYRSFAGDFDGDRRDDIFWYGPGSAPDYLWFGKADGGFSGKGIEENRNARPVVGDYNNDGQDDVIWYGPGTRPDGLSYGRSSRKFKTRNLSVMGTYQVPLPGDYDGNGNDDVFWYGAGSAPDYLWSY